MILTQTFLTFVYSNVYNVTMLQYTTLVIYLRVLLLILVNRLSRGSFSIMDTWRCLWTHVYEHMLNKCCVLLMGILITCFFTVSSISHPKGFVYISPPCTLNNMAHRNLVILSHC